MKRSLILCSIMTLLTFCGAGAAHASISALCTADVVSPNKDATPNTPGTTDVPVQTQHILAVTGGTQGQTVLIGWDYSMFVDGSSPSNGSGYDATTHTFDASGDWFKTINLNINKTLTNGEHTFRAKTHLEAKLSSNPAISSSDDAETDEKKFIIGPFSTTAQPGGPRP